MPPVAGVLRATALVAALALAAAADPAKRAGIQYLAKPWEVCNDACGEGSQHREVFCAVHLQLTEDHQVYHALKDERACEERKLQRPNETQACFGGAPTVDFCTACSADKPWCDSCVSGFQRAADGSCVNKALEVVLEAAVATAPTYEWQKEWRPKLDSCLQAVVDHITQSTDSDDRVAAARLYGIRAGPKEIEVVSPRRVEGVEAGVAGAGAHTVQVEGGAAVLRAAVSVPQGLSGKQFGASVRTGWEAAVRAVGGERCPAMMARKIVTYTLCPGASRLRSGACIWDPTSGPRRRPSMPLSVWLGSVLAMAAVGAAGFVYSERRYRKQERDFWRGATDAGGMEMRMTD